MKKKKRRGSSKSHSDKFKKSHVFALIGMFLILGIALSFVNVPQDVSVTGESVEGLDVTKIDGSGIGNVFTKWEEGKVDNGISKIFIFFIVAILIFVSIDMLGVIKGSFISR